MWVKIPSHFPQHCASKNKVFKAQPEGVEKQRSPRRPFAISFDDSAGFVGDSFFSSSLEAPESLKIYEIYLKKTWSQISLLVGTRDLNADYLVAPSAGNLLSGAFGISPALSQTGPNGPSIFPNTALAANLRWQFTESTYGQVGVFNALAGSPDQPKGTRIETSSKEGQLLITEWGIQDPSEERVQKYALGLWSYSKEISRIDGRGEGADQGAYLLIDHPLSQDLNFFLKTSFANPEVHRMERGIEAGLAVQAPWSSRPDDVLTLGVAEIRSSESFRESQPGLSDSEVLVELSYSALLRPGLTVIPDFQWIQNPSFSSSRGPVEVLGLRLILDF